ncbi:hypothetical protein PMIN04_005118 [Paraphaeosphaeria minitans]
MQTHVAHPTLNARLGKPLARTQARYALPEQPRHDECELALTRSGGQRLISARLCLKAGQIASTGSAEGFIRTVSSGPRTGAGGDAACADGNWEDGCREEAWCSASGSAVGGV